MMTSPRATKADGGFTLIELLVSLALLALLLVFVAGGIRATSRAWLHTERLEVAGTTEALRSFLKQQLSEAMPRYYAEPNGTRLLTFGGEANGMTFVAPAPVGSGQFGLSAFSLDLVPAPRQDGGQALALSQLAFRQDLARNAIETAPRRVLLDNVAGLTFAYFGQQDAGDEPAWHAEWNSGRFLPQLIRIDLAFPEGDPRTWPPLIVELKLAVQPTSS